MTEIGFKLEKAACITLRMYDLLGREIRKLAEGEYESGYHSISLDASGLASGVYLYQLTTPYYTSVRKMAVMK